MIDMILDPTTTEAMYVMGSIAEFPPAYFTSSAGINFNNNYYWTYDSYTGLRILAARASITSPIADNPVNNLGGKPYNLTFKYTR